MFTLVCWALAFAIAAYLDVRFINSKMAETAKVMGKAAEVAAAKGIAKVWALVEGWKTTILAVIAFIVHLPGLIASLLGYLDEDLLRAWQSLPWTNVVDAKIANWITLAIAVLIPLTHSIGVNKAAKTVPVAPSGSQ